MLAMSACVQSKVVVGKGLLGARGARLSTLDIRSGSTAVSGCKPSAWRSRSNLIKHRDRVRVSQSRKPGDAFSALASKEVRKHGIRFLASTSQKAENWYDEDVEMQMLRLGPQNPPCRIDALESSVIERLVRTQSQSFRLINTSPLHVPP